MAGNKQIRILVGVSILVLTLFFEGCAATSRPVGVKWCQSPIRADGNDQDWDAYPLSFFDRENRTSVRVSNDSDAVSICLSVGDENLARQWMLSGLALLLDPEGENNPSFGVVVKPERPVSAPGKPPIADLAAVAGKGEKNRIESLEIKYPYGSGPMSMTWAEAREKGIETGLYMHEGPRLVFEARILYDAISSFGDLQPGTRLKMTLVPNAGPKRQGDPKTDRTVERTGGRSGGKPGGRRSSGMSQKAGDRPKNNTPFEIQMDLVLARNDA